MSSEPLDLDLPESRYTEYKFKQFDIMHIWFYVTWKDLVCTLNFIPTFSKSLSDISM